MGAWVAGFPACTAVLLADCGSRVNWRFLNNAARGETVSLRPALTPLPPPRQIFFFFPATGEPPNHRQLTRRAKRPMASDAERTDSRQPPASPPQARTVSFEGMAAGTCTDDVREVATYFGEIELLHTDRRGHGIVRFAQASAAQEFYDTLHGMGRQAGLVPDPVAPACTPPCGTEAGSTEPDAASPSASSPRMAQPVGSASHYSNGQSAGCGELAGGGAVAEAWASRDPARMPPSATVHIYNTSSAATHNDIHSRLSKYGTIHDIRKLPRRSGFLVDFLVPASAADCIANYHLKNRDLARWATPAALRQAPAPRSQWRRPHEDATTATTTNTTTATAAATAATTTTATATTAAPAPAALQQPPAPPHKYPCQRLASDEPVPGFGEVGDMGGEALCLRRAQASVLFTGVRPFMSAHNVETILSCFGPIQDVTIVPGKAEAVVSFVAHGSAVRCLRKFQHRRHTVQHVPLALYRLCHPDRYPARPIDCRPMC